MKTVVVMASTGRPETLHETLRALGRQTVPPERILVSTVRDEDVAPASRGLPGCRFLTGARGLCAQLNLALRETTEDEELVFVFDDDVEPAETYMAEMVQAFAENPGHVALGGQVIHDGARAKVRWSREEATRRLKEQAAGTGSPGRVEGDRRVLYGCSMAFRRKALLAELFDEALPLYSWLFEVDHCRRLHRHGSVGQTRTPLAHLASTKGRMSDQRMGYAQVANPYYLWKRKGTMGAREFWRHTLGALAANSLKMFVPGDPVDRRGRLKGNLTALWEIGRGTSSPKRIERM